MDIFGKHLWIINTSQRTFWRENGQDECIDNGGVLDDNHCNKYAI